MAQGYHVAALLIASKLKFSFLKQAEGPKSYTCMDIYVFGTPYRLMWDWYFLGRHHTEKVDEWHENEREFVETRGLSVFLMPAGMLGTLKSMWDVFPLFANTGEN